MHPYTNYSYQSTDSSTVFGKLRKTAKGFILYHCIISAHPLDYKNSQKIECEQRNKKKIQKNLLPKGTRWYATTLRHIVMCVFSTAFHWESTVWNVDTSAIFFVFWTTENMSSKASQRSWQAEISSNSSCTFSKRPCVLKKQAVFLSRRSLCIACI